MAKAKSDDDIAKDLKRMVDFAKKGAGFALCLPGKDSDPIAIEHSLTKKGAQLEKAAKKNAGGSKTTFGTLSFADAKVYFNCEVDPPAGLQAKLKKHLSRYGLSTKAAVVDPSGKIDDDEAPISGEAQKEQSDILKVFTPLVNNLKARFDSVEGLKAKTDTLVDQMQKLMEQTPFDDTAAKAIIKTAAALYQEATQGTEKKTPNEETGPVSEKLKNMMAVYKKNAPRLAALASQDPSKASAVGKVTEAMKQALAQKPVVESDIERVLRAAIQLLATPSMAEPTLPTDKYSLAVGRWTQATSQSVSELDKLHKMIAGTCKNMPGASKVTKAFDGLEKKIGSLEKTLNTALDKAVKSGDARAPEEAVKDTLKVVAELKSHLKKDAILKDIDTNPFLKIQARAALDTCLAEIESALT